MSDNLRQFFRRYLAWAESGAAEFSPFFPGLGLCANFSFWLATKGLSYQALAREEDAFRDLLEREFGTADYPFGDEAIYSRESITESHHLNPARLAFIRSQLA